jgi:aryl-alcohol dehydrogenase-like predicted oxidoreductase
MEYRALGRSGLRVSPLCLGTMMFGGPTDAATAARIVDRAAEQGVNFIDTANVYEAGRSEEIVGRAIAARRDAWVLATKLANPTGPGPNDRGLSRRHALRAVDDSLRRLGTDAIDCTCTRRITPRRWRRRCAPWPTSPGRARSAISASRISAPGASPKSAGCATSRGSTDRWSASPITTP